MRRLALLAAVTALLAAGCFGPSRPLQTRDGASAELRPMTLHVLAVHDTLRMDSATEPGISHYVEVAVVDGPDGWIGRELALPYDEWTVGAPPPRAGATVVTSPARWVRGDGSSHGKPRDGWAAQRLPR